MARCQSRWNSEIRDTHDSKRFYDALNAVYGSQSSSTSPLLNVDGTTLITDKPAILNRWAEHFSAVLNRSADINAEAIARLPQVETNTDLERPPSEEEVKKAVNQLSSGKAPGADAIPADVYKHGGDTLLQKLTDLFCRMWDEEVIPQQLKMHPSSASTQREIASFVTTTEESLSWS